jgi:hypothetical protein
MKISDTGDVFINVNFSLETTLEELLTHGPEEFANRARVILEQKLAPLMALKSQQKIQVIASPAKEG